MNSFDLSLNRRSFQRPRVSPGAVPGPVKIGSHDIDPDPR